jgi:hypothetical protein
MEVRKTNALIAAGAMVLLAGCGGGGGGGGGDSALGSGTGPTNATPGGIWRGNESVSGLQVIGIADEKGNFNFVRADGVQYVGQASVNGTSLTADVDGIVPLGFVFADGSAHGTGTITGTLQARQSINSKTTFKTDFGAVSNGTLNLAFDTLYNRASSLTTLSGNFKQSTNSNVVVTVSSNGALFSQDPVSGCVLNGSAAILNASYNAYQVQFDYASCVGSAAALNGVKFSGLATLDNTVSPEQIVVGATGTSGNVEYSLALRLNRD